jgi:hypothetical protein
MLSFWKRLLKFFIAVAYIKSCDIWITAWWQFLLVHQQIRWTYCREIFNELAAMYTALIKNLFRKISACKMTGTLVYEIMIVFCRLYHVYTHKRSGKQRQFSGGIQTWVFQGLAILYYSTNVKFHRGNKMAVVLYNTRLCRVLDS